MSAPQLSTSQYQGGFKRTLDGQDPRKTADNALRRRFVATSRVVLDHLRASGVIGDDAYRRVEEELDLMELSAHPTLARE